MNQTPSEKFDVVLATATEIECRAVLDVFIINNKKDLKPIHIENQTCHDLGLISNARVCMVQSEMGTGGPGGSLLTIQEAISIFQPRSIIMLGIAFGVDNKKQNIGEVLVSTQLQLYDLQRIGTGRDGNPQIVIRGDCPSAAPRLINRFRAGVTTWTGCKISFGKILSGNKLVRTFRTPLTV